MTKTGVKNTILLAMLVAAVAVIFHFPATGGGFVWDDDYYVTQNPTLTDARGLFEIWTDPFANSQYYPVTFTALWMEYLAFGDNPAGYHTVNILLHAMACALLFLVLLRIGLPGALLGALLFAAHPITVESVAWVSEIKNVLSGVFFFASFLFLAGFYGKGAAKAFWKQKAYLISLAFFLLAILSKSVTIILPAAAVIALWYKRKGLSPKNLLPLVPFFILGLAMGLVTIWVEYAHVGASRPEYAMGALDRLVLSGRVFWFYLGKVFWPTGYSFCYPRWQINAGGPLQWIHLALAAALFAGFALLARRGVRGPLAALLFYVAALFPAMGFVNVFPFRYSFVADHFAYLAVTGPIVLFSGFCVLALKRFSGRGFRAGIAATAILIGFLGILTWNLSGVYESKKTLYSHSIENSPGSWLGHILMAQALLGESNIPAALGHYREALGIRPEELDSQSPEAYVYNDLGFDLARAGRPGEAENAFRKALEMDPDYARAHLNLGVIFMGRNRLNKALDHFVRAAEIRPDLPSIQKNLALALEIQAERENRMAPSASPRAGEYLSVGVRAAAKENWGQAREALEQAILADPEFAGAHATLGRVLLAEGDPRAALPSLEKAIEIDPDDMGARLGIARAFLEMRKPEAALEALSKLQQKLPYSLQARKMVTDALFLLGRDEEAESERAETARLEALFSKAYSEWGESKLKSGEYQTAAALFIRALAIIPSNTRARMGLSRAYGELGRRDLAEHHMRIAKMEQDAAGP